MAQVRKSIKLDSTRTLDNLEGSEGRNLHQLAARCGITLHVKGTKLMLDCPDRESWGKFMTGLNQLRQLGQRGSADPERVKEIVQGRNTRVQTKVASSMVVQPKTDGQRVYWNVLQQYDVVFGVGPAGSGKCVHQDTLVLTDKGMIPIKKLAKEGQEPDEYVAKEIVITGVDGPETASHVYCGGYTDTIVVQTSAGFSVETTPEHPLMVLSAEGVPTWKKVSDLVVGDAVAIARDTQMFSTEYIPIPQVLKRPNDNSSRDVPQETLDEEFGYLMGALVGDGGMTVRGRITLTSADREIAQPFRDLLARWGIRTLLHGKYDWVGCSTRLWDTLEALGLGKEKSPQKQVPWAILQSPKTVQKAFLQGLFDTDGSVGKNGYVSYGSSSKILMSTVQQMLLNFGIVGRIRDRPKVNAWEMNICGRDASLFYDRVGFRLSRKADRASLAPSIQNSNVDVVPNVASPINACTRQQELPRKSHKKLWDYRIGRRKPSYQTLVNLRGFFQRESPERDALDWVLSHQFFWDPIVSLSPSQASVFDLTVPKTHSFVAGGFLNHNTLLAVAAAVKAFAAGDVKKIIITRPVVDAGESLGFLPGGLEEKIDPYLRPIFDSLELLLGIDGAQRLRKDGAIEIAPIAYLRGRTFSKAFVLLDEAQNCTPMQIKMFLTRLGEGSRMVVTGDRRQSDIRGINGLVYALEALRDVEAVGIVELTGKDIVRHELVGKMVDAFESLEQRG